MNWSPESVISYINPGTAISSPSPPRMGGEGRGEVGHLSQLLLIQETRARLQNGFGLNLEVIVDETRRDDGDIL